MLRWPEPYGDSWNRTSIAMMQTQYNNLYIMSPYLFPILLYRGNHILVSG